MTNQIRDRMPRENRIGVERDDDLARRFGNSAIQRRSFAAVFLAEKPDLRMTGELAQHLGRGAVGRAVVDHDDVEGLVPVREHSANRARDHLRFVEGGDHDADRRSIGFVEVRPACFDPRNDCQDRHEDDTKCAENDGGDERDAEE